MDFAADLRLGTAAARPIDAHAHRAVFEIQLQIETCRLPLEHLRVGTRLKALTELRHAHVLGAHENLRPIADGTDGKRQRLADINRSVAYGEVEPISIADRAGTGSVRQRR